MSSRAEERAPEASASAVPSVAAPARPRAALSEVELIAAAEMALRSAPRQALVLCQQHALRFGAGPLAEEREVIAVEALVRLGQQGDAERRGAAFGAAFPGSAYGPRIERALSQLKKKQPAPH